MPEWRTAISASGSACSAATVRYGGARATAGRTPGRAWPSTAQRSTCSSWISDRRASRSQVTAPTAKDPQIPATGPSRVSSIASRASTRRTPSTNATRAIPSSTPSSGAQAPVSTPSSTEPSAGAKATSRSTGDPYSGAQVSTWIRATPPGGSVAAAPGTADGATSETDLPMDRDGSGAGRRSRQARRRPSAGRRHRLGHDGPLVRTPVAEHRLAERAGTAVRVLGPVDGLVHEQPGRRGRLDRRVADPAIEHASGGGQVEHGVDAAGSGPARHREHQRIVRTIPGEVRRDGGQAEDAGALRPRLAVHGAPRRIVPLGPAPDGQPVREPEGVAAR